MGDALTWRASLARLRHLAAVASLSVIAAACAVDEFQMTTGPRAGFASDQRPALLIGTWASIEYIQTGAGLHSSETIWELRGDGSAIRTQVLRQVATGLSDQTIGTGVWGAQGGVLSVRLDSPQVVTLRMRYSVAGNVLLLDSREFQRVR